MNDRIPLPNLPPEKLWRETIPASPNLIKELNNPIALIANNIPDLLVPKHRHGGTAIVPAPSHPIYLFQSSAGSDFPQPVRAGDGEGDGDEVFEGAEGADDEGAVGPGAGEGGEEVEVEGRGCEVAGGHEGEEGRRAGVGAGGGRWGQLLH